MDKLILLICATFISVALQAQVRTEKRAANPFTDVSLRVNADLYIVQGKEHSIEITGDDKTLDKIIVEVIENKLIIRFSLEDRWTGDFYPDKLEIHVVATDINLLALQGSGNIYAEDSIDTHHLELCIAGSGDIKVNHVKCDRMEANISGSGDIFVTGSSTAREIKTNIAGSGDVITPQLTVEAAYILIAGSGNCEINVTNYLDAKIFGSGDIKYKGEPSIKSNIAGSGRIHNTK